MKVSAIEIGTNSIKFLIVRFDANRMEIIEKMSVVNRLSRNMYDRNLLSDDSIENALRIIGELIQKSKDHAAKLAAIFSTSVLRDAQNSDRFSQRVLDLYGMTIEVLSGEREAVLAFRACAGCGLIRDHQENLAVIDIGGGSTELTVGNGFKIISNTSYNIGAVRLTELFVRNDPALETEIYQMKGYIQEQINPMASLSGSAGLVGVGGTVKTLGTICSRIDYHCEAEVNGLLLKKNQIETIYRELKSQKLDERKRVIGLHPKRADVIVAGIIILMECMKQLGMDEITVSSSGVIEGYLAEYDANETTGVQVLKED